MNPRHPRAIAPWLFLLTALVGSRAWAQSMINAHVTSGGEQGNAWVGYAEPSLSDDGRYIAFHSQATNLVAGDTNNFSDCFVHDNLTGTTVLISLGVAGAQANADCFRPSLSSSGRYVAYVTTATNLVAGDTNGMGDVFRHDRDTDADGVFDEPGAVATIRVSVATGGAQTNGHSRSYESTISDDGDRIVFESDATNLVAGDTNGIQDCFLRIVSAGTTTRLSVSTSGAQSTGSTSSPAISGNGAAVVLTANSSPGSSGLTADDTNDVPDVFVRDLVAGTTTRVSVSSAGAQGNGSSLWGTISDDGLLVSFESSATNLVAGDVNGTDDVFVHDRSSGTTTLANLSSGGAQSNSYSSGGTISGNGLFVLFQSAGTNLVGGDGNGDIDVFVRDRLAGTTVRASRAVDGTEGNEASLLGAISDDGASVAFISYATNLGPGADTNGFPDAFVRGGPFLGPGGSGGTPGDTCVCQCASATDSIGVDANPVTFSVNGPVDPHTEGIRYARGTPPTPQLPFQPGNPIGFGIRFGPVPQAAGIDALATPGDVFDYDAAGVPSEAVMFESTPLPPPDGSPPDGSNNQVLEAVAMGVAGGPPVMTGMWTSYFLLRDNIDAFSFGEDYFPDSITTGLDMMAGLPTPPIDPMTGEIDAGVTPWAARASVYSEPIVMSDAPGISFRMSVDPWAIGLPATSVLLESGGFDIGAGLGPWTSPGDAAGDIFGTPVLTRVGGATVAGGTNSLVWDNPALALAPLAPPADSMEDDVDAVECVGENDSTWMMPGGSLRPGHLHARVEHVAGSGLPPPDSSWHDPVNARPVFFSVTRNSPGVPFSGVRTQFVTDGGAAGDVYVAVKDPMDAPGVGLNLLFIDESELGLYAMDASLGGTGPADFTDDLDALILCVCDEYRPTVVLAIEEILGIAPPFTPGGYAPWAPYGSGDALIGGGMTISITKYLAGTGRPIPEDCIHVGFSVTTDAIGLEFTGVDYEAGPVFPVGGVSAAAGDVFFAEVDGDPVNPNSLWYEEMDLGFDEGTWVNGASMSLDELSDNLNALDAINFPPDTTRMMVDPRTGVEESESSGRPVPLNLGPNFPNPFNPSTTMAYTVPRASRVTLAIFDIQGRRVATLVDEFQAAGRHVASWNGQGDDGAHAPSGVYFARLESGGESKTGKIMLVK